MRTFGLKKKNKSHIKDNLESPEENIGATEFFFALNVNNVNALHFLRNVLSNEANKKFARCLHVWVNIKKKKLI